MRILLKNWLLFTVGLALTAIFVRIAYRQRGYVAFGGEWLILPFLLTVRALVKSFSQEKTGRDG